MMSLQRRRERYTIIHMWKILNGKCPNDIGIEFRSESRHGIQAKIPPMMKTSSQHNQTQYDGSFAVLGPSLWNILPRSLHTITNQEQFKTKLTEFLFNIPDTPPVPGYCPTNSNSLLDWCKNRSAAFQQQGRPSTATQ